MRYKSRIASLILLAAATLAAHADTIYSQFGPGPTFVSGAYFVGPVTGTTENEVIAEHFVPTETATLTDAILALRKAGSTRLSGSNPLTVFIESSVAGAPSSIIDTLTQAGTVSSQGSLIDFTCASCSVLDAGTMYFLVAYQSDSNTGYAWDFVDTTTKGPGFYNEVGSPTGPWTNDASDFLPAFEVNGTAIAPGVTPEPSSLVLIGTGIVGLANAARRKFLRS